MASLITHVRANINIFIFTIIAFCILFPWIMYQQHELLDHNTSIAKNNSHDHDDDELYLDLDLDLDLDSKPFPFYIFVIGFNKCATRSIIDFLSANNIPSAHYFNAPYIKFQQFDVTKHKQIRSVMDNNYLQHKPLLTNMSSSSLNVYMAYADFSASSPMNPYNNNNNSKIFLYEILSKQYKNSKFILNIRDMHHWIKSRYLHYSQVQKTFLVDYDKANASMTDIQVIRNWMQEWHEYICNVLEYFERNKEISNNLLIFDIEMDNTKKMIEYFYQFNLTLNETYLAHIGNTKNIIKAKLIEEQIIEKQIEKWDKLITEYPQLVTYQDDLNNKTQYQRLMQCL